MKKFRKQIKRIGLIANSDKAACRDLVRRAARLIRSAHRMVVADKATANFAGLKVVTFPDTASVTRHVDLVMVFGGDGTILRVAREMAGSSSPILGINVGGLGFLTDVQAHLMPLALRQIWNGQTILTSRSLIEAHGIASGESVRLLALNDIVITRGAVPHLTELEVSVDDIELTRYRCDGLIVCAPTGSTAYSLSAGGAIVSPDAEVFALTPICPHTLSNRSVIVSLDSVIRVKVANRRADSILSADGQEPKHLAAGDAITICRSQYTIRLLHLAGSSFFETLRRKLNWKGTNV